jgi:hypothetical protein
VLADSHTAEDAFQVTFLILVHRAAALDLASRGWRRRRRSSPRLPRRRGVGHESRKRYEFRPTAATPEALRGHPGGGAFDISAFTRGQAGGGGVKGGHAIGATSKDGATVEQTPVGVSSFLATVYKAVVRPRYPTAVQPTRAGRSLS